MSVTNAEVMKYTESEFKDLMALAMEVPEGGYFYAHALYQEMLQAGQIEELEQPLNEANDGSTRERAYSDLGRSVFETVRKVAEQQGEIYINHNGTIYFLSSKERTLSLENVFTDQARMINALAYTMELAQSIGFRPITSQQAYLVANGH